MSTYPTVRPSLTLDFQKSKQLDPRISFSRSSSATYVEGGVVKYADEHQARFEEEGLLIEESRTNLVTNSNFPALKQRLGISDSTAASILLPDGTTGNVRAFTVDDSTVSPFPFYRVAFTTTGSQVLHTGSVWIRAASGSHTISVSLSTASGPDSSANTTVTTSWKRVQYTRLPWNGSELFLDFYTLATANTTTFYIWGSQIEEAPFPTSLIPTAGSAVTRAADVATITGTNFSSWYNATAGTFYVQEDSNNNGLDKYHIFISNGANNDRLWMSKDSVNRHVFRVYDSTNALKVVSTSPVLPSSSELVSSKFVGAYFSGDSDSALDGSIVGAAINDAFVRSGSNSAYLGSTASSSNLLNGHISRLAYYSRRLTDAELQTITL